MLGDNLRQWVKKRGIYVINKQNRGGRSFDENKAKRSNGTDVEYSYQLELFTQLRLNWIINFFNKMQRTYKMSQHYKISTIIHVQDEIFFVVLKSHLWYKNEVIC